MNITYLNGSPKTKNSSSHYLLKAVEERVKSNSFSWHNSSIFDITTFNNDIKKSQALIISLPLYIDGIPSHLIYIMELIEQNETVNSDLSVYIISNCGFYEGKHNKLVIEMFKIWVKKCGFGWGYGIGIGAGGMIQTAPVGEKTNTTIGKTFDTLANDIQLHVSRDDIFVGPNFPRFLYLRLGHILWKKEARKNHIPVKNLKNALKELE